MQIQERLQGDTVIWAVHGQLTGIVRGSPFDEPLRRALLGRRAIVIDLAAVSLVDAGGLGLLLTTYRAATEHRIAVRIANVSTRLRYLLELTHLATVLPVVESVPARRTTRYAHGSDAGLGCAAIAG